LLALAWFLWSLVRLYQQPPTPIHADIPLS
jgi:hypothetical protein